MDSVPTAVMDETLFVVNPNAASGRAARVWETLCHRVGGLSEAPQVRCLDKGQATDAMLSALRPETRRVIAVGGDGTLHHILNVLFPRTREEELSFGLIPIGTGSDLARGLKLASKPEHVLRQALQSKPRRMDILRLKTKSGDRYLINVASLGLSAPVVAHVNSLSHRNTLTFLSTSLKVLLTHDPHWVSIRLDGKFWREGSYYLAVVANGSCFAKGMRIAPNADPHDGYANVVFIEAVPKTTILRWLPTVYLGKHFKAPFVHWAQAREVEFETHDDHPIFEGDGELTLPAPGNITLIPGAVRFCGTALT